MFLNYIKLAFKVLGRKKFYTFISLFGISFTLMILMGIAAYLDMELGNHAPLSDGDKLVMITRGEMSLMVPDTSYVVDSNLINGEMVYDTTDMSIGENRQSHSISPPSFTLLDKYLRDIPYTTNHSFVSSGGFEIYLNAKKLDLSVNYTDAPYWEMFDFEFLEGGAYGATEVANQSPVIVISEKARDDYFGEGITALGKDIAVNEKSYRVVGVVENVVQTKGFLSADAYVPYTHMRPGALNDPSFLGNFRGLYMAESRSKREQVMSEIEHKVSQIPLPNPEDYNVLKVRTLNTSESFALSIIPENDKKKGIRLFYTIIISLISLFILLPTLNLVNINVTRIMERSSEIGVRKAFGATTGNLLLQFIFENIILTVIGGILGFIFALILIRILNDSNALGEVDLVFYPSIFFYGLGICLVFGIISGLLPAYRMSKIHVVSALKQNAL